MVNALSHRLDVEVDRGGKTYAMSFRRGEPGIFDDPASGPSPGSAFTPFVVGSELRVTGRAKKGVTGTRIRYWADRQVFTADAAFTYDELVTRIRQTSFLVPGLRLTVRDERGLPGTPGEHGPHEEVFVHEGGIGEFVEHLAVDAPVTDVWRLHGTGHFHETVPVLDAMGHLEPTEVERECVVDVALRWGTGYDTTVRSFVNIIATPKGGTHLSGFEASLLKTFRQTVEANARRLKAGNDKLEKDDVLAGLTAVLTVRLAEPQFEGQTKEVLGTSAVRGIVVAGGRAGAHRAAGLHQAGREAAGGPAAGEGRRRDEGADQRPGAQGDPASQERAGDLVAAGQAGRLPQRRRRAVRAVHRRGRQRARHRQAGPLARTSRRCCRSAARSSTSRRPPSPTC